MLLPLYIITSASISRGISDKMPWYYVAPALSRTDVQLDDWKLLLRILELFKTETSVRVTNAPEEGLWPTVQIFDERRVSGKAVIKGEFASSLIREAGNVVGDWVSNFESHGLPFERRGNFQW